MAAFNPATDERDEEDICGGIAPDDCCGQCPDCLDALDDERQLYGEDGAF